MKREGLGSSNLIHSRSEDLECNPLWLNNNFRILDSCVVLGGTLQQCLVGTELATSQLESQSLTTAPRVPVLDLNFQLHQLTIWRELYSIASYVILTYRGIVGPEIHDFQLDDQLTVFGFHGFPTVRSQIRFPSGSFSAHCWRVPTHNKTAIQCSSPFSAFKFTDKWWISNWKFQPNPLLLTKCQNNPVNVYKFISFLALN